MSPASAELTIAEIDRLRTQLDRDAVKDVIYRLARAIDRCDKALLRTCFHDDATDDHGLFKGTAADFCDWVMTELEKFERTQHLIANINLELNSDKAATESYFFAHHVVPTPDGKMDMIAAGRYLDRFEKRDGDWRISHRHAVYDWNRAEETKDSWGAPPLSEMLARGVRGSQDLSYNYVGGIGAK